MITASRSRRSNHNSDYLFRLINYCSASSNGRHRKEEKGRGSGRSCLPFLKYRCPILFGERNQNRDRYKKQYCAVCMTHHASTRMMLSSKLWYGRETQTGLSKMVNSRHMRICRCCLERVAKCLRTLEREYISLAFEVRQMNAIACHTYIFRVSDDDVK